MNSRLSAALLAGFFILGYGNPLSADIISWGTAQDIASATEVSTDGTLVFAGMASVGPVTVNGVNFVQDHQGFIALSANPAMPSTGDASYDALVSQYGFLGSSSITPSGTIVVGRTYQIQIWQSEFGAEEPATLTLDDGNGNTVDLDQTAGAIGGQYVIGTFVADDAVAPTITMSASGQIIYNAYQVRDITAVPERGALGVLGIMGLAFLTRRGRRRS